ncbi:amidoligase family protein [Roseibium sp.]|uniref:amidoligase family protein n=2 Tax=Roseibium sp. TaxID=1936156 RepID=UPI00326527BB
MKQSEQHELDTARVEDASGRASLEDRRRVGVEVEFGGMSARQAAEIVQYHQGGVINEIDAHRFSVKETRIGGILLELDSKYVHSPQEASGLERQVRRIAGDVTGSLVPTELVTDPLPVSDLAEVDRLIVHLSEAGALGTQQPHLACGLHLNIEWLDRDVTSILRVLQAYLLMAPALREAIDLDTTRTLLPFIGRFPKAYEAKVLDPDYQPDFQTFARDYCKSNSSKNRELDLLPLLASIDADAVREALGHEQEAVRPTFHYRLPNACLGDPDWSIVAEWKRWLTVEALASDRVRLRERLCEWRGRNERSDPVRSIRQLFNRVMSQ